MYHINTLTIHILDTTNTIKNNFIAVVVNITAVFLYMEACNMEKRTFYIHKSKNSPKSYMFINNNHRVVSFIGGDKDIIQIIKKLIESKYK